MASPLILEDFSQVYTHFPILFGIDNERLMAYVLLNDGQSIVGIMKTINAAFMSIAPLRVSFTPSLLILSIFW
ncbi:MAG: hypothetical protein LRY68_00320 [Sulfurospirillum sp.]|nr:hypothetical protein [Sulfurospirillum sp.]